MEQAPRGNEGNGMEQLTKPTEYHENQHPEPERPMLSLNLASEQGTIIATVGHAYQLLPPDEQDMFREELKAIIAPGTGHTYDDVLALVNMYTELIDTSGKHPVYGNPAYVAVVTRRHQQRVMAAVDKLNEQLQTLPERISVHIDGLYPEFDNPEHAPEAYIAVLNDEIGRIEGEIEHASGEQREALEKYRLMLRACRTSLRRAGVL